MAGERMSARDAIALALAEYYGKGPAIGAEGDFYTASNVSLFPQAIRRFVDAACDRLGGARVAELGGGSGALASALGLDVTIVEPHAGLASAQRARGLRVVPSVADLPRGAWVVLANEVLDALPPHRVIMTEGGLREAHVRWDGARVVEEPGEWTSVAVEKAAAPLAPLLRAGQAAEVCVDAGALLRDLARVADPGILVFLDYGGEAREIYGEGRPRGTLRGFHAHRVADPYERLGEQDVTADVDLTLLRDQARGAGFEVLGMRTQGEFLADLGLLDDMMAALARGDHEAYVAAKGLLLPGGMGDRFRAVVLGRGVGPDPPLPGLRRLHG